MTLAADRLSNIDARFLIFLPNEYTMGMVAESSKCVIR